MSSQDFSAYSTLYDNMRSSLSDPRLPGQYIRKNQQAAVEEDMGLYDYGAAAATGLLHGATLSLPEQYMRVIHRLGTWLDSEDTVTWARGKLDEYAALRQYDPAYQPDAKWMNSYLGKSLYQGFNSLATSAGLMLPGLALMPLTGGLGGGILGSALLGTATSGGTLAGIAEFDNFIDEAYTQLKAINPNLTREEIEDEHFWSAAYSGLAEGGLEFASDVLGGKLIGMFGKAGAEPARHIISKLFRNTMRGMISEVPSELATAGIQDWIRENAGLDHQGRLQAMIDALGPSLVTGGAFGLVGTAAKEAAGEARQPLSPLESKQRLEQTVAEHIKAQLQDDLGDHAYQFYADRLLSNKGMTADQAKALASLASEQARAWARETGRDSAEWWAGRNRQIDVLSDAGWSDTLAVAQALVTPDASFDNVVNSATDLMWNSLSGDQQTNLSQRYSMVDEATGEVGVDRGALQNDFAQWMQDPKTLDLDASTEQAFGRMREKLLDSYNAVSTTGSVKISRDAQQLFETAFKRLGKKELKQPSMFQPADMHELQQELLAINTNSAQANEQIADAFVKNSRFNFSPWTVGEDIKATFARMDEALGPQLDSMLKRQNDAEMDAKAKAEMMRDGYTEAGIQSLFDDAVDHEEGSLSYRLRKAIIYQTVALKNIQQLAQAYNQSPSPENGVALRMASTVYAGVHAQMRGLRAESGRGLQVWRTAGKDNTLDKVRLNEIFENGGGQGMHDKIARLIANATDLDGVKDVVERSAYARGVDMLVEHVTLGMLTNPATQVVNVTGNGLTLVQEVFNRLAAQSLSKDGGIVQGETGAMINGFFQALRNIRQTWGDHRQQQGGTWAALKNIDQMQWDASGNSLVDDAGMMTRQLNFDNARTVLNAASDATGISHVADALGLSSAHAKATNGLSTAVEYYGRSLGIVSKALLSADQFFKTIAYHMELNARNYRKARNMSGGNEASFKTAFDKLSAKPLKADKQAAMDFAKRVTFQQDLGAIGRNLNKMRIQAPLLRLVIPFLKTPINILKYGAAHTPLLNQLVSEVRAELNSTDSAVRQLAEARVMTGTMLWTAALGMAAQGMLTGSGPADLEERKRLEATGWQPNSLKIGDSYIGMDRLDPAAFIFNTAASFLEIANHLEGDDLTEAFTAGLGAAMRTITNRSYLQSVDNIMNMVMNIESTQGQKAFRDVIGSIAVPASALTRTTARVIDPVAREVQGTLDLIKSNIPGFSMTVPERRNFLGEVMKGPDMWGPDYVMPFRASEDNHDPVYAEISRLGQSGHQMPGMPQRAIQHGGNQVKLDAKQYSRFLALSGTEQKINGQTLKQRLASLVVSPMYGRINDEQRAALIEDLVRTYRKAAKNTMIKTDPGIRYVLGLN